MKILKRHPFTLLEVLIGFLLILIALVPLFAPYPYMFKRQQELIRELEMDRLASLYYVDLLEAVLTKKIDPAQLAPGEMRPVEKTYEPKIPYKVEYRFQTDEVIIVFTPNQARNEGGNFEFKYAF